MTLLGAVRDPNLFAPWFRDRASWRAWEAFLAALFALPLDGPALEIYRACTGRERPPTEPAGEAWLVCGRRAGKSFVVALTAVYLACFRDWRPHLAPGERATVMVLAADRRQARVILRYVDGLLTEVPMLAALVENRTAEALELTNRVTIEIHTASFRSVRGYTVVAALCDELAFWRSEESANPDREILEAIRPAMATVPGAMLLCASSPYGRRGALWEAYRDHHGRDGDPVLVWRAATRTMNPLVPQRVVDAAYERDPASAAAEYGAEFRSDLEGYVGREVLEALVPPGVHERPPVGGVRYAAFVDPSGGSRDAMTLAVAHREGRAVVLDALRERRPPFSPEEVVGEFAALLRRYGIARVAGDRYGGEWPRERFRASGIGYEVAERAKAELYWELLPLLTSPECELLDSPRLVAQLSGLERRVGRGGRDVIDHAPGGRDDLANAAAGALVLARGMAIGTWTAEHIVLGPLLTAVTAGERDGVWASEGMAAFDW